MRKGNTYKKKMDELEKTMDAYNWSLRAFRADHPESEIYVNPTAQEIADEEEWWEETMKPIAERMKKINRYHPKYNPTGTLGRY